jgi:hypothetical protein
LVAFPWKKEHVKKAHEERINLLALVASPLSHKEMMNN